MKAHPNDTQAKADNLLNQHPASYNELIDFFEAYLTTLQLPILHLSHKVNDDEIEKNELRFQLVSKADEAYLMGEKLAALRAWHNQGDHVTITFTTKEAGVIETATAEVPYLLSYAESVFAMLCSQSTSGFFGCDPSVIGVLELCSRALREAGNSEGVAIEMLDRKLR